MGEVKGGKDYAGERGRKGFERGSKREKEMENEGRRLKEGG